jgi:integrase
MRWKSTKKKTKAEALKVVSEFQTLIKQETHKITFLDFQKHFLSIQSNHIRQSTINRICLPAFLAFVNICGNKVLTEYSLKDVETFKHKRLETCTPTTVNIAFRTLRSAFNFAIKWQFITENPFDKSSQIKAPEQSPTYLTREEFKKLLEVVQEVELKEIFTFAALTGMRQGEIINLQWNNIDFQNRQINIKNTDDYTTKTGKQRIVPMNELLINMLTRKQLTQNFSPFVFHMRGRQLAGFYVSHKFKEYIRLLKFNDKIHFHSLRHTFATWLVQNGVNIYEVQKLLGHSSVKVTEVYSHLVASELHNAVNKISIQMN